MSDKDFRTAIAFVILSFLCGTFFSGVLAKHRHYATEVGCKSDGSTCESVWIVVGPGSVSDE